MVYCSSCTLPVDSCRLLVCAEVSAQTQDLHVRESLLHERQCHLCALQFNNMYDILIQSCRYTEYNSKYMYQGIQNLDFVKDFINI